MHTTPPQVHSLPLPPQVCVSGRNRRLFENRWSFSASQETCTPCLHLYMQKREQRKICTALQKLPRPKTLQNRTTQHRQWHHARKHFKGMGLGLHTQIGKSKNSDRAPLGPRIRTEKIHEKKRFFGKKNWSPILIYKKESSCKKSPAQRPNFINLGYFCELASLGRARPSRPRAQPSRPRA